MDTFLPDVAITLRAPSSFRAFNLIPSPSRIRVETSEMCTSSGLGIFFVADIKQKIRLGENNSLFTFFFNSERVGANRGESTIRAPVLTVTPRYVSVPASTFNRKRKEHRMDIGFASFTDFSYIHFAAEVGEDLPIGAIKICLTRARGLGKACPWHWKVLQQNEKLSRAHLSP